MSTLSDLDARKQEVKIFSVFHCFDGFCRSFLGTLIKNYLGDLPSHIFCDIKNKALPVEKNTAFVIFTTSHVYQIQQPCTDFVSHLPLKRPFTWRLAFLDRFSLLGHKIKFFMKRPGSYLNREEFEPWNDPRPDYYSKEYSAMVIKCHLFEVTCKFPNKWPKFPSVPPVEPFFTFWRTHHYYDFFGRPIYFTSLKLTAYADYRVSAECRHHEKSYRIIQFSPQMEQELVHVSQKVYDSDPWVGMRESEDSTIKFSQIAKVRKVKDTIDFNAAPVIAFDTETICATPSIFPYLVYFFSETLNISRAFYTENNITCNCAQLWNPINNYQQCDFHSKQFFYDASGFLCEQIAILFLQGIRCLVLVGYNNFKFDNAVFLGRLITNTLAEHLDIIKYRLGAFKFTYTSDESARNNKSNQWTIKICFFTPDDRNESNGVPKQDIFTIIVKDCITFIPDRTLATACKDYHVVQSKLNFDIVKACEIFEKANKFVETVSDKIENYFKGGLPFGERLKMNKIYLDENKNLKLRDLTIYYCEMDTRATYELFTKVTGFLKIILEAVPRTNNILQNSCLHYLSIPNLGFEIFREILPQVFNHKIIFPRDWYRKIEETCFGGRCDFSIVGEYFSNNRSLAYFDVTSEYPLAMLGEFPVCESWDDIKINFDVFEYQILIDQAEKERDDKFIAKDLDTPLPQFFLDKFPLGFFSVDFFPPKRPELILTWGPIAYRAPQKLYYTNNIQKNRFLNTIQIRLLVHCGWHVQLHNSEFNIIFHRTEQIFKPFTDFTGKLKTEAREDNKSLAKLLKLIMNSIAGKLGQRSSHDLEKKTVKYFSNTQTFTFHDDIKKGIDAKSTLHYLASFVWAYANQILYNTFYRLSLKAVYEGKTVAEKCGAILYCDTDSVIFDREFCTNIVFECSEELGTFDAVSKTFNATWKGKYTAFDSLIVACKKVYACIDKGELLVKKIKGVHGEEAEKTCNIDWYRKLLAETVSAAIPTFSMKRTKAEGDCVNVTATEEQAFSTYNNLAIYDLQAVHTSKRIKIAEDDYYYKIENKNTCMCKKNNIIIFCCSRLDNQIEQETMEIPPGTATDNIVDFTITTLGPDVEDDKILKKKLASRERVKKYREKKKAEKEEAIKNGKIPAKTSVEKRKRAVHQHQDTDGHKPKKGRPVKKLKSDEPKNVVTPIIGDKTGANDGSVIIESNAQ